MRLALFCLLALPLAAQTVVDLSATPARPELTVRGTASTLTIGGACSIQSPCNVRQGSLVRSYPTPATVTITSGSGTVYLYVDQGGNIAAGVPAAMAVSCSGCLIATGITGFPVGSVPLATWTAAAGLWTQGSDMTALLSSAPLFNAGPNVTLTQTPNTLTIGAQ